jgi:hypothetical protein
MNERSTERLIEVKGSREAEEGKSDHPRRVLRKSLGVLLACKHSCW